MKFKKYEYADVSTGVLPQSDRDLLLMSSAPNHLATHDEFCSAFFYTLADLDPGAIEIFAREARDFGLSDRFVEIMVEASRQRMEMVRFDCDGDMVEGLELIEVEESG